MYRVDRRIFEIDQIITAPDVSYQDQEAFNNTIENILSDQKPISININRRNALFIFIELSDAIRFSCLMTDSKIYKVTSSEDTEIYYRGDMNWTETMQKTIDNEEVLRLIARLYWTDGCKTFKPCWEVLVNKMKVNSILLDSQQRNQICLDFRNNASNVESLQFYKQNLLSH
jgi:hypothetical protein